MSTKKLIEVALPLPEINDASAFDKRPGIGAHPKGIHHWWARLPLPTARAILFASIVDDPSEHPDRFPTEAVQDAERERLFQLIREMMSKKLHEQPEIYAKARLEMNKYCDGRLPAVLDPFSGGGSIPLEASRLGLEAHAADLNPIAVLMNKCNLELAPRWTGHAPVNPDERNKIGGSLSWRGTAGLARDILFYGKKVRERAVMEIGHLYPRANLPPEHGGAETNVIAWLWSRTVASPNPAAKGRHVPLLSTFWLSTKTDKSCWLEPIVDKSEMTYRFEVRTGVPVDSAKIKTGTTQGKRKAFFCLLTGSPITYDHIRSEGREGRLRTMLTAIVVETQRGRTYVSPTDAHQQIALSAVPSWTPTEELPDNPRDFKTPKYGLKTFGDLFTPRQLTAMVTLSNLVQGISTDVERDAASCGLNREDSSIYAKTVVTFLALALDRCADLNNSLCRWDSSGAGQRVKNLFGRQAIPMLWDFAESNILGQKSVCWQSAVEITAESVGAIACGETTPGFARQIDAASGCEGIPNLVISTDPPYYDNISYAALSDFFYVWLRRTIGSFYPDLFGTLLVPKMPELTASPDRFEGSRERARDHFESGFRRAFSAMRERIDPRFPLTVYYAFKQNDEEGDATAEDSDSDTSVDLTTGWETLLEALISSGFQITATWPVRASQSWRMISMGANALASYIVLACRARPTSAPQVGRRDFLAELKRDLPAALKHLQQGNVAPVDFAQACIGPGMAVYSRYTRILESDGRPMTVRTALALINQIKEEVLGEPESDYDPETRWALIWFDQNGFAPGEFGDANTLATAHAISVAGLQAAGVVASRGGKVRLVNPSELSKDWNPAPDQRLTVWEMTHHLMRLYHFDKAGDAVTAALLRQLGSRSDAARDLAYRLFSIAERRKRSADAQGYNALVLGWPELTRLAQQSPETRPAADSELNFN